MERTEEFDDFIDAAYEKSDLWRLICGLVTAACVFVVLAGALVMGANAILGTYSVAQLMDPLQSGSEPASMFLILLSFFALLFASFAAAAWHHRDPGTLFGPRRVVTLDFLRIGLLAAVVLAAVWFGMQFLIPDTIGLQHAPLAWALMMLWAIPLLLVQVTAEEVVFRGYLTQQLAARFESPFLWAVVPSLLFGALHFDPTIDTSLAIMTVAAATIFGLLATDLTRLTGSIGAAIGYHFVNNFFAVMLLGIEGQLSGLALFLSGFSISDVEILRVFMVIDISVMFLIWVIARRLLQR